MKRTKHEPLFLPEWQKILIQLSNNKMKNIDMTQEELSRHTGTSFSWQSKIIKALSDEKYLTLKRVGRTKKIILTNKGDDLCAALMKG